ncbi:MAG: ABC transporter substrate-binding protein [Methanomassiliicoccales archaeon]|nr:ABC transporter substrate-binding protein [Methanomassiliicoccales archaeon]
MIVVLLPQPAQGKTIYWIQIAPKDQATQLAQGKIDGAVSWEPFCSDSILAGTAHAVKWSEEIWPGHPCCVLAVKTSYLQANSDLVARMVRAHIDASNWINDAIAHPDGANYTLLLQMGSAFSVRNTTVVAAAVGHITFDYQLTDNVKNWLGNYTDMFADLGQLTSLGAFPNVTAFVKDFVNDSLIAQALAVQPSDTILNPQSAVRLGYLQGDLHQFARVVAMNSTVFGGKTLYEKYGVNVTSANPAGYVNGPAVMTAFAGNVIDVGYLGAPPAILNRLNANTDVQVVALANSEGSAILGVSGINTFADFDGKVIATPGPGSIQHLLLLDYAKLNGFNVKLKGT